LFEKARGAYSIVAMTPRGIAAVRDPQGYRPLVLGRLDDAWVFASETTSLDLIGATYEREVEPGEIIVADWQGLRSHKVATGAKQAKCVFEFIYFARPDSIVFGQPVYEIRKALGRQLAKEHPVPNADIVIPVPDSGVAAAIGFAEQMGVPFDMGLIRSHYVGRTFIEPEQRIRNFGVKLKLNPLPHYLRDKVVVVVDDSLVRGTTSRKLLQMLRARGPKEIHLRLSSPPVKRPCHFGIDTPTKEELIASRLDVAQIAEFVGADSVGYLSIKGMLAAVGGNGYCTSCFEE
jgi:amidophosphoribosyltransferase